MFARLPVFRLSPEISLRLWGRQLLFWGGAVVILGVVGYFSGVVQVPITASVIVMEMTDDPSLALPLMATSFIGFAFSRFICPMPLYRTLARAFLKKSETAPSEQAMPVSSSESAEKCPSA
ncbi:MAG: chloride channel protein [Alphaproteobacteria bacterium]|nr:chloride channel protein [Alphaproteobacteria bacterium]